MIYSKKLLSFVPNGVLLCIPPDCRKKFIVLAAEKMITEGRFVELMQEICGVTIEMLSNPGFVPNAPANAKTKSKLKEVAIVEPIFVPERTQATSEPVSSPVGVMMPAVNVVQAFVGGHEADSAIEKNMNVRKQLYSPEMI